MRILISGSNGLIGSALMTQLATHEHTVFRLTRSPSTNPDTEVLWNPCADPDPPLPLDHLGRLDAVVHLAGENIAAGRWSRARKERIRASRVSGTHRLATSLARLTPPPRVFVCASAIGYYGDRGDEILRENGPPGNDFLATVCRDWETATAPAGQRGIRVVRLRLGVVLSARGGALAKMLPSFRLGLGGPLGPGSQWMSWVLIDDVIGAIGCALANDALRGPVNVVAPHPVTNAEFARTLGSVLRRPAVLSVPAFALRGLFGEMASALLLASQRVEPACLQAAGYIFKYPELDHALRYLLASPSAAP